MEENKIETVETATGVIERGTGILERLLDIVNNNKFTKILKAFGVYFILLFFIVFTVGVTRIAINPIKYIERVDAIIENKRVEDHKVAVDKRLESEPKMRLLLKESRLETRAERAFIFEFHNSVKSLNGVPFIYADMRYEDYRIESEPVDFDYQQQPVSRYPMATYLISNKYFFGDISDVEEVDPRLAKRLKFDGIEYVVLMTLSGEVEEIGFYGLSFTHKLSEDEIDRAITITQLTSSKLSVLMSK